MPPPELDLLGTSALIDLRFTGYVILENLVLLNLPPGDSFDYPLALATVLLWTFDFARYGYVPTACTYPTNKPTMRHRVACHIYTFCHTSSIDRDVCVFFVSARTSRHLAANQSHRF